VKEKFGKKIQGPDCICVIVIEFTQFRKCIQSEVFHEQKASIYSFIFETRKDEQRNIMSCSLKTKQL